TRSSTRGRPPSESTSPASTTSRSSISSPVTLLTVATLSPLSWLSSCRLSGPSKNSLDSRAERLRRRRSRTVLRWDSMRRLYGVFHCWLAPPVQSQICNGLPSAERTSVAARIGALVALDAPAASYYAHIILADQVGITPDTMKALLVTLAPLVGSARVVSAADNVLQVVRQST